ncbi:MAG: hypothetical protein M3512_09300 [Bacteroidota bacterium]|nr:hypothetical protein [Bacteroidota bacterium]
MVKNYINQCVEMSAIWGALIFEPGFPFIMFSKNQVYRHYSWFDVSFDASLHLHYGIYSFSALMMAKYFLFVPEDFPNDFEKLRKQLISKWNNTSLVIRSL